MTEPPASQLLDVAPGVAVRIIRREAAGARGGVPFLLVHGLSSNARLWDDVAVDLSAAGHPSVAVDQRGHGLSSKPTSGYDFGTLVDDLTHVLTASFDRPAIVAGQSWGGNVVVELAARRPQLVAGVVCVDGGFIRLREPFPDWSTAETTLRPPPLAGRALGEISERMRQGLSGFPESGITAQLANFELLPDGTVRPWLTLDNHMRILRQLWEHDPHAAAAAIEAPVLVMAVGDGRGSKAATVGDFVRATPRGAVQWMDAHHDVHAQQPHAVAAMMAEFAASVPQP